MQELRITKYLGKDDKGNDEFVITVPPQKEWNGNPTEERIKVAHDYVEIFGSCSFQLENGVQKPESQQYGASNWLSSYASLQIDIRDVHDFIIPFLSNHEYLQDERFTRYRDYDDKDFEAKGLKEPRWKKGDPYPAYAYSAAIIHYYDKQKGQMVAFKRAHEAIYNHVTLGTFNIIRDTLKLCYTADKIDEFKI